MGWKSDFVQICGKIFLKLIWNREESMGQWNNCCERKGINKNQSQSKWTNYHSKTSMKSAKNIQISPNSKVFSKTSHNKKQLNGCKLGWKRCQKSRFVQS